MAGAASESHTGRCLDLNCAVGGEWIPRAEMMSDWSETASLSKLIGRPFQQYRERHKKICGGPVLLLLPGALLAGCELTKGRWGGWCIGVGMGSQMARGRGGKAVVDGDGGLGDEGRGWNGRGAELG